MDKYRLRIGNRQIFTLPHPAGNLAPTTAEGFAVCRAKRRYEQMADSPAADFLIGTVGTGELHVSTALDIAQAHRSQCAPVGCRKTKAETDFRMEFGSRIEQFAQRSPGEGPQILLKTSRLSNMLPPTQLAGGCILNRGSGFRNLASFRSACHFGQAVTGICVYSCSNNRGYDPRPTHHSGNCSLTLPPFR